MKTGRWARGWMVLLVAMLAMGLTAGCSDSDDDDGEAAAAGATGGGTTGGGTAGGGATADGGTAGDAADPVAGNNVNVVGTWNGTRSSDGGSTTIQIRFEQQVNALRGSYQDGSGYAGTLRGTIAGDDIQFTLTLTQGAPGDTWTFTGAVNATGTSLNGNMRSEAGTDRIQATK
jgi:hypothetical protein